MSLLPKLREFFTTRWSIEPEKAAEPKWRPLELEDFIEQIAQSAAIKYVEHTGGVRKAQHKQWTIDEKRSGGRIVKTMPRNLRQMKELAEKTDE